MQPVSEVPNYSISQDEAMLCEQWIKNNIKWNDAAVINKIPDLPANRATLVKKSHTFRNSAVLSTQVLFKYSSLFIGLAEIVWRRRDDQLEAAIVERCHVIQIVATCNIIHK